MDTVALRYAEALFSLASDKNSTIAYQKEANELIEILEENKEFIDLLSSPFLSVESRIEKVEKTFSYLSKDLLAFICIIVKNSRAEVLLDILEAFNSLCNRSQGIIEGIIFSTEVMDKALLASIEARIGEMEKSKIHLINKIDPSLIGGFKVLINDHQYDNSIAKNIEKLRKSLIGR